MKKKLRFIILLTIGLLAIIPSFILFSIEDRIIDVVAIFISSLTAVFAIFVESDTIKNKKQEVCGNLKRTMIHIISQLERRNYDPIDFSIWRDIRKDQRHQLVDKELREKLDNFFEKINKHSDVINKLDFNIIPKIIDEAVLTVFSFNRSSYNNLVINIDYNLKKQPSYQSSISSLNYYLKRKQSLIEIIYSKAKKNNIEKEEIHSYKLSIPISSTYINNLNKITKFWNRCLEKIENVSELKQVVENNDALLEEAKEIKEELIKQIEKTIES